MSSEKTPMVVSSIDDLKDEDKLTYENKLNDVVEQYGDKWGAGLIQKWQHVEEDIVTIRWNLHFNKLDIAEKCYREMLQEGIPVVDITPKELTLRMNDGRIVYLVCVSLVFSTSPIFAEDTVEKLEGTKLDIQKSFLESRKLVKGYKEDYSCIYMSNRGFKYELVG